MEGKNDLYTHENVLARMGTPKIPAVVVACKSHRRTYRYWKRLTLKRATGISEMHLKSAGVEDCVSGQRRRKYRLA